MLPNVIIPQEVLDTPLSGIFLAMKEEKFPNLQASTIAFLSDLEAKRVTSFKLFTEKQEWWFRYYYAISLGVIEPQKKPTVDVGSLGELMYLFAQAEKKLKHPSISLETLDGIIELKKAGPKSKYRGSLQVTDGKPFGQNVWYGAITQEGEWKKNGKLHPELLTKVGRILTKLAVDPVAAIQRSAHLSGRCCFCSKKLTEEHSTAIGFGAVCAENFGLFSQWKKAKPMFEAFSKE